MIQYRLRNEVELWRYVMEKSVEVAVGEALKEVDKTSEEWR
jgi:hypothetical protein